MRAASVAIVVMTLAVLACVSEARHAMHNPFPGRVIEPGFGKLLSYTNVTTDDLAKYIQVFPDQTLVVDVRDPLTEYATGHIPGAVNLPLPVIANRSFELPTSNKNIYVICRGGFRSQQAAEILSAQGFTNVFNVLGGMLAWQGEVVPENKPYYKVVTADDVKKIYQDASYHIIDVRAPADYAAGHIPGAINIPSAEVESRIDEIYYTQNTVFVCYSGRTSEKMADLVSSKGYFKVATMAGGMNGWDGPVEPSSPQYYYW